jgi:hypothetical protein
MFSLLVIVGLCNGIEHIKETHLSLVFVPEAATPVFGSCNRLVHKVKVSLGNTGLVLVTQILVVTTFSYVETVSKSRDNISMIEKCNTFSSKPTCMSPPVG